MSRPILLLAALACLAAPLAAQDQRPYDLIITGGQLLDGTGNPAVPGEVAIRDGRIAAVGRLPHRNAKHVILARGKVVAPGFIDIHSHADDGAGPRGGFRDPDPKRKAALNIVTQGVTTVVVNQDGRSPWPVRDQRDQLRRDGIGPNAILLAGHGTIRGRVMGTDFRRPATPDEVARMRALLREALADGAWGLSAGLEYVPGRWSTTDEVAALVEEIVPSGGVYISHERSEGRDPMWYWPSQDPAGPPTLLDAVKETIEIGERTGARVVASHLKAKGATYWGSSKAAIELIARARARGVDVWADQYPYTTSGTDGNTVLIPGWALGRGPDQLGAAPAQSNQRPDYSAALRQTLADAALAAKAREDVAHEIIRRGGAEKVLVQQHPDTAMQGKTLAEIAARLGVPAVEAAFEIQFRGNPQRMGGGRLRGFSLDEVDLDLIAAQPWVATASDGGIGLPEDGPATHARFYGTFPRKIRRYAIERGVLRVEDAVRSMTTLPAQILGLADRGGLREGMWADVVVFDLGVIRDRATFTDPHQYAEGVEWVLVNGEAVVEAGKPTGKLAGKVLIR
ncbi:MAG TPA: amidohydrolase family protein [Gemmatimonadales bacterium]